MTKSFTIDFAWLDRHVADEAERFTFAEIKITVGGVVVTELEDVHTKTIRSAARVSAYALALWLLGNWWRLVREPERKSHSWQMSHRLGAIGQGFLWPDLSFSSDGDSVLVRMAPTPQSSQQMVRYLNGIYELVSVADFEAAVLSFVDAVIDRLQTMGCRTTLLQDLRKEIVDERSLPSSNRWREIEALLGHDPDEGNEELIAALIAQGTSLGPGAVDEVLAHSKEETLDVLAFLFKHIRQQTISMVVPDSDILRKQTAGIDSALLPWERAAIAARSARKHWSLQDGPVSNDQLRHLFSLSGNILTLSQSVKSPITVGFRNGKKDHLDTCLHTGYETSRRFALLRVIGDQLFSADSDSFLPVTDIKTARQKFQRAFAQEFLCPADELKLFVADDFGEEKLDDAAHYFNVSTRLIETTLVNKGLIERDYVFE